MAARRRLSQIGLAVAALALLAGATGCSDDGSGDGGGPIADKDAREVLDRAARGIILPTYRSFEKQAKALKQATAAYLAALKSGGAATSERDAARAAFKQTMAVWQRAELMQIGPAGAAGARTGGQSLRDEVYSWPTVNACAVDQQIVAADYRNKGWFESKLVDVYGLDAIEYLLFYDDPANQCPSTAGINSDGSWKKLAADTLRERRADYADAAAGYLVSVAGKLVTAWDPDKGDYAGALAGAGQGSSKYSSTSAALDELFAALYYVEVRVRHDKLAIPLGLSSECTSTTCPKKLESQWAKISRENIVANLEAAFELITGTDSDGKDGKGFDDLLTGLGASKVASDLVKEAKGARDAARDLKGTLRAVLSSDLDRAKALHSAVKRLTDLLKAQVVSVLKLRIPSEGAGDSD